MPTNAVTMSPKKNEKIVWSPRLRPGSAMDDSLRGYFHTWLAAMKGARSHHDGEACLAESRPSPHLGVAMADHASGPSADTLRVGTVEAAGSGRGHRAVTRRKALPRDLLMGDPGRAYD